MESPRAIFVHFFHITASICHFGLRGAVPVMENSVRLTPVLIVERPKIYSETSAHEALLWLLNLKSNQFKRIFGFAVLC